MRKVPIYQDEVTPRAERMMSDSESAGPPRLSPNSLERKFYTEFHNLESMELSIKQLTSVDRTRAVSMAQQETVSLAQMLKVCLYINIHKQIGLLCSGKHIQPAIQTETFVQFPAVPDKFFILHYFQFIYLLHFLFKLVYYQKLSLPYMLVDYHQHD